MSAHFGSDPWLDARLRNVPLPAGMLQRLSQIGDPTDEQLDAAICDVPLPPGLGERLCLIAQSPERRFGWLPVDWLPQSVDSAGRSAASWTREHIGWRELALAASLLLAVGVGYLAIAPWLGHGLDANLPGEVAAMPRAANGPGDEQSGEVEEFAVDSPSATAGGDALPGSDEGNSLFPPIEFKPLPLPGPRLRRPRNLLFASDPAFDRLPALETASLAGDRGLAPPLVASYDLLAQLKSGERSFVSPSADAQLAWTPIPLGHDTSSYRLVQRAIRAGHLPAPEDVRIEDFLNAQCDHYPPADSPLVIRVAAGPAPLGEPGLKLLQVGAQAGRMSGGARPATSLTIAVDTSASMWHGRRLEMVRAAMRRLVSELTPADRVTLIGFSDDAQMLADNLQVDGRSKQSADRAASDRWLAAVERLVPENGTNVGAGIALASDAIGQAAASEPLAAGRRRQFVLLSDGLAELGPDAKSQIAALLGSLARDHVAFSVLDVSGERDISAPLGELAAAGDGLAVRAADTEEISSALTDALAGYPQTVARSAALKVTFNPQAVGSYRLVGHATTTLTGPAAASTQVDLHAGACRSGLLELWLLPGGGDEVATVELTWHDPSGTGSHKLTQRISRLQFAKSFAESPLSLQAAAIASEAARSLRAHAGTPGRGLARVAELSGQANPLLAESDSFRQLVALVGQADKLRVNPAAVRRSNSSNRP